MFDPQHSHKQFDSLSDVFKSIGDVSSDLKTKSGEFGTHVRTLGKSDLYKYCVDLKNSVIS